MKKYRDMKTAELDALLRQEQDKDGAPDVNMIKAILRELDRRGELPAVDTEAAWADFRENWLGGASLYAEDVEQELGTN